MPWVYDKLVQSSDDIPGQFAYLYYKFKKRELAENLKTSGTPDTEIPERLKTYQQNVAEDDNALAGFREEGSKALKNYLEIAEAKTLTRVEANFDRKNREIGQAIGDLNTLAGQQRGKFQRFASWLAIGLRAWLSTAIFTVIIAALLLLAAWITAPKDTQDAAESFWDKALSGIGKFVECQKSNPPETCQE